MTTMALIDQFLSCPHLALAGVSRSGKKFGNIVLKELTARGYRVAVVHPVAEKIADSACCPSLADLPEGVDGLLIAVPREQAVLLVREAAAAGIRHVWLARGAESPEAIEYCQRRGINVIHNECILMFAQPTGVHRFHRWLWGLLGKLPALNA
jgi:uncharacterized protein